MDLTKQTDTELKALGYEQMMSAQTAQNNLQVINQELAKRNEEPVVPVKEKDDGKNNK